VRHAMSAQLGSRTRNWTALGGALLAIILPAEGCGGSESSHADPTPRHNSELPLALQALVAKMRVLHVTSERYRQISSTQVQLPRRTERFHDTLLGEVALSPDRGETFQPGRATIPRELVIGSARYVYSPPLGSCDGGRPWVREGSPNGGVLVVAGHEQVEPSSPTAPPARASLPFQAFPGERTYGGSGPFAGLINLLETAAEPVRSVGVATVDGQRTTEFTARVDPASLLVDVSERELPALQTHNEDTLIVQLHLRTLPTQLHLFLTASGLPVRVTTSARIARTYLTGEQIDGLSVNSPVSIAAPPANQVIGSVHAAEYEGFLSGHTKPCPALARKRRAPIGG
jgi:hypothetical protein